MRPFVAFSLSLLATSIAGAQDAPPKCLDPEIAVDLFAEAPQITTPTGIDVDPQGRVWAIECNTHFRPEGYERHPTDRLLILTDADADARCDSVKVFADGFTHAMSVAVRPAWMDPVILGERGASAPRQVFLATRRAIWLLEDTDHDDVCDKRTEIAWLDTPGDYPHNGLAGFAFDALGWMYFGFGENLGAEYKLFSREMSDRRQGDAAESLRPLTGKAEGGNIYRMRPDGTGLSHWATGFWNPHASCVDGFGRLFTVDNDPDSRPPCRLLHVIDGGDYGYKFRNGRKGLHPFTSWNGEIPGTLPMVAGTGEAPSGILAYEHDAFPDQYLGNLFVTSWGDHRIDRFVLKEKGASFESIAEPFVTGGENFRPVGIALAPDGSLYCTDWVLRDYKLHGQGRVWRIRPTKQRDNIAARRTPKTAEQRLNSSSLTERRLAAEELSASPQGRDHLVSLVLGRTHSVRARVEALWVIARIPMKTAQIKLFERADNLAAVFDPFDEVTEAACKLTGLPQISFLKDERDANPPLKLNLGLDAADPTIVNRRLMAAIEMTDSALRMKSVGANMWGLTYIAGLSVADPFVATAAIEGLARREFLSEIRHPTPDRSDLETARWVVLRRRIRPQDIEFLRANLQDPKPSARRVAVQWAAEENLAELRPDVEAVLRSEPMTPELFLATLAALDMLDGHSPADFEKADVGKYVLPLVKDEATPTGVRVQALRLLKPESMALPADLLIALSRSNDEPLRMEAIRTLAARGGNDAVERLIEIVTAPWPNNRIHGPHEILVGEAVLGLATAVANSEQSDRVKKILVETLDNSGGTGRRVASQALANAVVRSLRGVVADPDVRHAIDKYAESIQIYPQFSYPGPESPQEVYQQTLLALGADNLSDLFKQDRFRSGNGIPSSDDQWREILAQEVRGGDEALGGPASRGRFVFYHPQGPGCAKCHTVHGRGGNIGPDLSRIGATFTREKLIDSILDPSREVSPQFTNWSMSAVDGKVHTGMIVHENEGTTILGRPDGTTVALRTIDIETRTPQRTSVMPEKLEERLTIQEFRDLLSYLESLK